MPRSLYKGIAVLLLAGFAFAQTPGHITGAVQTATGGTINNGTLTFTLSQPSVVSGTATLVTQPVACYTSNAGSVVGVPDPIIRPILSTNTGSGTLAAGTYFVEIYYTGPSSTVSAVSPEASVVLTSTGTVIVQPPALQPANATGYGVAISATTGTETIQGTVSGFATQFQQSSALTAGSTPASTNNSVCNLYLSDELIPTGTYYSVNLVNKNGSPIAGYPQSWCTYGGSGATINVSQGTPTGNCNVSGVFYPTPILSTNANLTSQSISTPVTFSGSTTLNGTTTAASLNGVLNATQCSGADLGAQLNTCYANLPATGGRIRVPNSTTCYTMSTAFSATTAGKPVIIEGDPGVSTCISWTPTTGTAFTFDTRLNSNQHPIGMGMRDLKLTTSSAVSSTAVVLGSTNSAEGYTLMHVEIENFITGVSIGTTSITGSFANLFLNDVFRNMTTCLTTSGTQGAEMSKVMGGSFFNCGTGISGAGGTSDWIVIGTSCDDPGTGSCIGNNVGVVNWYAPHFENPGGGTPNYVNSNGIINIYGGVALDDCISSGNPQAGCTNTLSSAWFSNTGTDSMVMDGIEVFTGGRTLSGTTLISLGGSAHGTFRIYNKSNFALLTTNNFVFSQAQDLSYTSSGIQTARFQSWSVPETGSGLPSGVSQFDLFYGDPTLHGVMVNTNNAGFVPLGSRAILTADWTCGTGGTVASCTAATIIGSGGGVPWTFSLPLTANSLQLDCDGVVGQASGATSNQWNLLTATNGATNVTATYDMYTAATAKAGGAVTDQASTTSTFQIAPNWTLGGTGTKMPFHIHAAVQGASASGTVLSVQLLAPTVGDLVTIYQGSGCWVHP